MMKNWRMERDNYPHVGQLADAIDDLKSLASSGFSAPAGLGRVVRQIEPIVALIDTNYTNEKVCALALESVLLVTRSVRQGRIDTADEARIMRIVEELRKVELE